MTPNMPRWLLVTIIIAAVLLLVTGLFFLFKFNTLAGWIVTGVLVVALTAVAFAIIPQLIKLYRFQKYFKAHEDQLRMLPTLMQTGRTQEAMMRFEGAMKNAPDSAYIFYLRAYFLQAAGKIPEAMVATNKALSLIGKDPYLEAMLQQVGGQMGQPTTVAGFREQLEELQHSLEPRVSQMKVRREKAAEKRKKKSR